VALTSKLILFYYLYFYIISLQLVVWILYFYSIQHQLLILKYIQFYLVKNLDLVYLKERLFFSLVSFFIWCNFTILVRTHAVISTINWDQYLFSSFYNVSLNNNIYLLYIIRIYLLLQLSSIFLVKMNKTVFDTNLWVLNFEHL